MIATARQSWSRFVRLSKPLFASEMRGRAAGGLALLLALLLTVSGLNVAISYVGRDFMTAIAERAPSRYYAAALLYLAVFAASTVAGALSRYTELRLGLRWREWLTQDFIRRYLSDHAYCRVNLKQEIDNPDQRISEDVRNFTTTSLSFAIILFSSAVTVVGFAGVLWSITPWLFVAAVLYPAFGTILAVLIGHRLVGLNNLQLKKEADLRYELVRVREHADSLALARREEREGAVLRGRLGAVVGNYRAVIDVLRNLKFFSGGYNYLTQLIPVLIVAPLYMQGRVEFGVVAQATMAFSLVFNAFSLVVEQFQDISTFAAIITRLASLAEAIDERPARPTIRVKEEDGRVAYRHLTLRTPKEGHLLIRDLTLEVPRGRCLLITGTNGVGKSALFRATAGVWEWGEGRILRPPWEQLVFLPQRPYMTPGTLREQLLDAPHADGRSEERLREVLKVLRLEPVVARVGGLGAEMDWTGTLSLGEQQLLALARLLLADPAFAFLDHATSALRESVRQCVYRRLAETAITYISVGDDHPSMLKYHDAVLELGENGEWKSGPMPAAAAGSPDVTS
jgi:putative ATP-binding cassette transporter